MYSGTGNEIQARDLPLWRSVSLGIKVIFSEVHWSIVKGLRSWEIKQLQKRLRKEYQDLGRLNRQKELGQEGPDTEQEVDLCREQIDFLEKELKFLQQELERVRTETLDYRRQKWEI